MAQLWFFEVNIPTLSLVHAIGLYNGERANRASVLYGLWRQEGGILKDKCNKCLFIKQD